MTSPVTELILTGDVRLWVAGEPRDIEAAILSAARGSLLELAWLVEAGTGQGVGINPDHVLMMRAIQPTEERPASRDAAPAAERSAQHS